MGNDLLSVLQLMENERGISKKEMLDIISNSIISSVSKGSEGQELKINIDPKTGLIRIWNILQVVDLVNNEIKEISLDEAKKIKDDVIVGDLIEVPTNPYNLGRIIAQTTKNSILQKIRKLEKEKVYQEYSHLVNTIVSGVVRRVEKGNTYIDLGKTEAIIPSKEKISGEQYTPGERLRCLLLKVPTENLYNDLILSRTHPLFVKKLFELEVSEISDGTVKIHKIARDPGYKTKISVTSIDSRIDPLGACIGSRGMRIKNIMKELDGEKIDIFKFNENPIEFLKEAVKPIILNNIKLKEDFNKICFDVNENDFSLLIGKKGKNINLLSKIIGCHLEINSKNKENVGFQNKRKEAIQDINKIEGLTIEQAEKLVSNGIVSSEAFEGVTIKDLEELGFSKDEASIVIDKVKNKKVN